MPGVLAPSESAVRVESSARSRGRGRTARARAPEDKAPCRNPGPNLCDLRRDRSRDPEIVRAAGPMWPGMRPGKEDSSPQALPGVRLGWLLANDSLGPDDVGPPRPPTPAGGACAAPPPRQCTASEGPRRPGRVIGPALLARPSSDGPVSRRRSQARRVEKRQEYRLPIAFLDGPVSAAPVNADFVGSKRMDRLKLVCDCTFLPCGASSLTLSTRGRASRWLCEGRR